MDIVVYSSLVSLFCVIVSALDVLNRHHAKETAEKLLVREVSEVRR